MNFKVRSKIGNDYFRFILSLLSFLLNALGMVQTFMIANYALLLGVLFFIFNNYYNKFLSKRKEEKMIRINQSQLEFKRN